MSAVQKTAILAQVGHFYFGAVGQFYIGANTKSPDRVPARLDQFRDVFVVDILFDKVRVYLDLFRERPIQCMCGSQ